MHFAAKSLSSFSPCPRVSVVGLVSIRVHLRSSAAKRSYSRAFAAKSLCFSPCLRVSVVGLPLYLLLDCEMLFLSAFMFIGKKGFIRVHSRPNLFAFLRVSVPPW